MTPLKALASPLVGNFGDKDRERFVIISNNCHTLKFRIFRTRSVYDGFKIIDMDKTEFLIPEN